MKLLLTILAAGTASVFSLLFSSLTYSLRDYSRTRLAEYLGRHNGDKWFESITDHTPDLVFLTAIVRQFCNILMWVSVFASFEQTDLGAITRYVLTVVAAGIIAIFCSVTLPHAAAKYAAAEVVGFFSPFIYLLGVLFSPLTRLMHGTDNIVRRAFGVKDQGAQEQIEQDILSVVEEGEKEGIVDEQEREMIESVIEFRDLTAGHVMTPRSEISAVGIDATLDQVKAAIAQSGHSRVPVYEGSLDHVVGILNARDLIRRVGTSAEGFSVRDDMRPALFAPETRRLRDLLADFRMHTVQIAVVLDEYGNTAGLVTLDDIFEELVGELGDEHEPAAAELIKQIDDRTAEADGRVPIGQLNRQMGLTLPEDAEYQTLAGYLSSVMWRIPEKGAVHERQGARFTVLESEPHRVVRVKIELTASPSISSAAKLK